MRSKRSPPTGASRSPRRQRAGTPLSSAFSRAFSAARRETSTVVRWPRCARAAATPAAAGPAHSSRMRGRSGSGSAQAARASCQVSERGRNAPGRTRSLIVRSATRDVGPRAHWVVRPRPPPARAQRRCFRRAVRRPAPPAGRARAAPRARRRRGPAARAVLLLRAALPRLRRRRSGLGVGPRAARRPRGPGGALRGGAAGADRPARPGPGPGGDGRRAARAHERRRRDLAVAPHRARGDPRAGARIRRASLRLSAPRGRPALVGDPAPVGRAEGGADRDPGGRVRRRPAGPDALGAVRPDDGGAGARPHLRRLPGPHPRRHARHGEPDVAVRAAPPPARRDRRPPRAVRDDLLHPEASLRRRVPPAGLRGRHPLLRRSRDRPRRAREHRRRRPGGRPGAPGPGARRRRALGRAGAARRRGALGRPAARRLGGRRVLAAPGARRGARVTAAELRAAFDAPEPFTVGLEEEAMLLDPETLGLAPVAGEVLERAGDARVKRELPAAQLEVVPPPAAGVPEAIAELAAGRGALRAAAAGLALPAVAGVHPFAPALGELSAGPRYDEILAEHGDVARAQQVCALQVHVAVGGADRTLAVYNALRGHLAELAALAANAPFHAGRDTGLASVRPLIGGMLPRQGVPPAIASWEAFAESLRWGRASGAVPEGNRWWFELRPHVAYGTLELRVPDAQTGVAEAAAVAAFAHALVAWLAERPDAGEPLGAPEGWRIAGE